MSKLISGKEALIALANGEEVETKRNDEPTWSSVDFYAVNVFKDEKWQFRLKPRTITLNGIEVPAPDYIESEERDHSGWFINIGTHYYVYKSQKDYDAVVAALRSVFKV